MSAALDRRRVDRGRVREVPEDLRRAIGTDLRHPLWSDSTDAELADRHRTSPAVVRMLRGELRRDLRLGVIVQLADELAERLDWPGPSAEVVEWALRACIDPRFRPLVEVPPSDPDPDPWETRHAS